MSSLAFVSAFSFGALTILLLGICLLIAFHLELRRPAKVKVGELYLPPLALQNVSSSNLEDSDTLTDVLTAGWIRLTSHPLTRDSLAKLGPIGPSQYPTSSIVPPTTNTQQHFISKFMYGTSPERITDDDKIVFGVLRADSTLYIYENEDLRFNVGLISLVHVEVSLWPEGLRENECYIKDFPVRMMIPINGEQLAHEWYLYAPGVSAKEDWFLHLRHTSNNRGPYKTTPIFISQARLLATCISSHADPHTLWTNALIGRVFLSLSGNAAVGESLKAKLSRKFSRLPRPSIVGDIHVDHVFLGDSPPAISNLHLHPYSPNSAMHIDMDFSYTGNFSISISTTVTMPLGPFLQALPIPVHLTIVVKRLSGHLLMTIKPLQATNRAWLGFYPHPVPLFDVDIIPLVGESRLKIEFGWLINVFRKSLREALEETMFLPNMDDFDWGETFGAGGFFGDSFYGKKTGKEDGCIQSDESEEDEEGGSHDSINSDASSFYLQSPHFSRSNRSVSATTAPSIGMQSNIPVSQPTRPKSSMAKLETSEPIYKLRVRKKHSENCIDSEGSLEINDQV